VFTTGTAEEVSGIAPSVPATWSDESAGGDEALNEPSSLVACPAGLSLRATVVRPKASCEAVSKRDTTSPDGKLASSESARTGPPESKDATEFDCCREGVWKFSE
jgi:hypothetical protein